ncbi:SRPBCC domain-containing protein [Nocardia sp. CNY236]|uniref:SRPBCC family protein n=1 Tax=Nocardia sp. CNY236 TaxID=1169152 RepID=UPI00040484AE|nr:SRPBCC domain-containing protein [Nocardia sp. CNY236]
MSDREFTIVRMFDAPRDLVFQAWLDPEQFAEWAGPHGFSTPLEQILIEPWVDGRYEWVNVSDSDASAYPSTGVIREIIAPERLVFAWGDPTGDGSAAASMVTVTFTDTGDGTTTMHFHLHAPGPLSPQDGAEDGWGQSIERLARVLRD